MDFCRSGLEYTKQLVQLRLDYLTEDHGGLTEAETQAEEPDDAA